jgi:HlyD family secretion protein
LDESLVQYEKKQGKDVPFIEVKQKDGKFKKVYVKLGASDGINVQVLPGSNITKESEVKVWNPSDKDKEELKEKSKAK